MAFDAAPIISTSAGSANDNAVTTPAIDTTGADLIVVAVGTYQSPTSMVITDSKSNSWTALTSTSGGGAGSRLFYTQGGSVGSGHTFTASQTGSFVSIAVQAWKISAAAPFDVENLAVGNGVDTIQPGSITPTEANTLVVAGGASGGAVTLSISAGFTMTDNTPGDNNHHNGVAIAYQVQTTATAVNPTWTPSSGNQNLAATIASFKAAAGGGSILPIVMRHYRQRRH